MINYLKHFIVLLVTLVAAELVLRFMGHQPLQLPNQKPFDVIGGERYFTPDPILGFRHVPGKFKIQLPDGYEFITTHNSQSFRITHPPTPNRDARQKVWIFGCSLTYGWGLNDAETYPWLLQQKFKNFEFVNFAVSSYGTLQSFLQFKEALKQMKQKPKVVVLAYADFHKERNLFLHSKQREIIIRKSTNQFAARPYAWLDKNGQLQTAMTKTNYWAPPLIEYSSLINLLDKAYAKLEKYWVDFDTVTERIFLQFNEISRANGIRFVIAEIGSVEPTVKSFAESHSILYVNISTPVERKYTNLPHDSHPSGLANKFFAKKLGDFLAL